MASAITHFIVGGALALPALKSTAIRGVLPPWAIPISSGLLALAPDLDTFAMRAFEIPYSSFFGHRGFFHSPFFLILLSAALAAIVAGRHSWGGVASLTVLWAGCAITHPLLDALTDGGSGVMLLFPFSEALGFSPGGLFVCRRSPYRDFSIEQDTSCDRNCRSTLRRSQ